MSVESQAEEYYWYHCVRLGDYVTNGDYDLEPLISKFGIPEDLSGSSVLDVGRASGFFSFLFESRGAEVTATDIPSYLNWDFVGAAQTREERRIAIGSEESFTRKEILGAFEFAHKVRNSQVKSRLVNVYDLSEERMGQKYDIVFCGSLLSHLRDPILALEKLFSVTGRLLILSTPILGPNFKEPIMRLIGTADSDRRSWWVPSVSCVEEMLRVANFSQVSLYSEFDLHNRRVDLVVPHAVFHAKPGS